MRAFAVTEGPEGIGAVLFADHAVVARRRGADEFADGEFADVSCRRAPWADTYAGRPLPVRVMIAHGWHFDCYGCGSTIDEDFLSDNKLPLDEVVGTQYSVVYCGKACAKRAFRLSYREKREKQRALDLLTSMVEKRFPDAEIIEAPNSNFERNAYVTPTRYGWLWQNVIVAFKFPGMKIGPAHLSLNRDHTHKAGPDMPTYSCCYGDREAFEAYVEQTKR